MADIQRIPFHEDELLVVTDDRTGKQYVLPRPLVEIFGLSWQGQHAKFMRNQLFAKGVNKMFIPTPGGQQEVFLLERRLVHAWLLSIDASRIADELQPKLLKYQEECADVLEAYFTKGYAAKEDPVSQFPELRAIRELITATAESKIEAQLARQEAAEAKAESAEARQEALAANTKAETVMQGQAWMTIHQYVIVHKLEQKFPESQHATYAKYLTTYCLENGYRIYPQPVNFQRWKDEQAYYVQAIHDTLPQWLNRRHSQITLMPRDDGSSLTHDPATRYQRLTRCQP